MDNRKRKYAKSKRDSELLMNLKKRKVRGISTPSGRSLFSKGSALSPLKKMGTIPLKDEPLEKSENFKGKRSTTGGAITSAIEMLRGLVRSKSKSKSVVSKSKTESIEILTEDIVEENKPKPKHRKPKKQKFRKSDFIKKMKETENLLLEYEKTRHHMEIDRKKMYQNWDMVADKIVMEQKSKSCLKKKVEALLLEDKYGLWEVSRRDKVNFGNNFQKQLLKLKETYVNALNSAVTDIGKRSYEYQKNIFDYNASKQKMHEGMANYCFETWKQAGEENIKSIEQFIPAIKNKSQRLNKILDKRASELILKLKCDFDPVPNERAERIEETFIHHLRLIEKLMETNASMTDANCKLIEKSTHALMKSHRDQTNMKKQRDNLAEKYKSLKDRLVYLHERSLELKRIVLTSASIIRMSFNKHLKIKKLKLEQQANANVSVDSLNHEYDVIKTTCSEKRDDAGKDLIRAKKNFFRRAHCALRKRCDASFMLQELLRLVKQEWAVDCEPHFLPTRVKPREELKFPNEGFNVAFGGFTQEVDYRVANISKTTVDLFHTLLLYYKKFFDKNGLNFDDLEFILKFRKFFDILSVVSKKQKEVFRQIKKDIKNETQN